MIRTDEIANRILKIETRWVQNYEFAGLRFTMARPLLSMREAPADWIKVVLLIFNSEFYYLDYELVTSSLGAIIT
ncbi:hypothetical protein HI914_07194 [Erysiphe necator]|nr:hypothetical protein HI914_07194 [Erysiphe necator]